MQDNSLNDSDVKFLEEGGWTTVVEWMMVFVSPLPVALLI